jgi:hypothetical protein
VWCISTCRTNTLCKVLPWTRIPRMRLRLISVGFAVLAYVSTIVVIDSPALTNDIQQNVKQNWLLGALVAAILCSSTAQLLWQFRRYVRVWGAFLCLLALHFLVAVPALGRLSPIRYGHIEELYFFLLAIAEIATVHFVLLRVTSMLPRPTDTHS